MWVTLDQAATDPVVCRCLREIFHGDGEGVYSNARTHLLSLLRLGKLTVKEAYAPGVRTSQRRLQIRNLLWLPQLHEWAAELEEEGQAGRERLQEGLLFPKKPAPQPKRTRTQEEYAEVRRKLELAQEERELRKQIKDVWA
jgi:hypothetical protein